MFFFNGNALLRVIQSFLKHAGIENISKRVFVKIIIKNAAKKKKIVQWALELWPRKRSPGISDRL